MRSKNSQVFVQKITRIMFADAINNSQVFGIQPNRCLK